MVFNQIENKLHAPYTIYDFTITSVPNYLPLLFMIAMARLELRDHPGIKGIHNYAYPMPQILPLHWAAPLSIENSSLFSFKLLLKQCCVV